MFRTALLLLSGNAGASLLRLCRNLLIASAIPVEDYGIAATFAMAITLVEMVSALGMQQQIVQSKKGGDPAFQAGLQGFSLLRGLMSGAILFFAAGWIAAFLGIPEVAWAYQLLALVPIATGLQHFDIHRLKRQMRFLPEILTTLLPSLASLLAVWPAILWLGDYRAMLVVIAVGVVTTLCITHILAERRYQLSLDRTIVFEALKFGWPLLLNNILLYLVFNGEKMIVGRELGMADLGILAMGITLTQTPTLVMAKTLQNFFLPQISALQDRPEAFQAMFLVIMQAVFFCAGTVLVLSVVVLPPFVGFVLGTEYAPLQELILWLALLQCIRVLKAGASVTAVAVGQTTNPMIANLLRVLSLPVAWWVAVTYGSIELIIFVAIGGELLGWSVSTALLRYRLRLSMRRLVWSGAALIVVALCIMAYALVPQSVAPLWVLLAMPLVALGVVFWTMAELQAYIRKRDMVRAAT